MGPVSNQTTGGCPQDVAAIVAALGVAWWAGHDWGSHVS